MQSFVILPHLLLHKTLSYNLDLPLFSPEAYRKTGVFLSWKLIYSFAHPIWKFSASRKLIFIWGLEILQFFCTIAQIFSPARYKSMYKIQGSGFPLAIVWLGLYAVLLQISESFLLSTSFCQRPVLDKSNFIFLWKHEVFPYFQLLPSFY